MLVGGLSTADDPRIQDRDAAFVFGEPLQKFLVVWLVATVSPAVAFEVITAILSTVLTPVHYDINLGSVDSKDLLIILLFLVCFIGLYGGAAVGQWWVLRRRLPQARRWAIMTTVGVVVGGIVTGCS